MGMYYPGLDIALALLYLLIIWQEGRYKKFSFIQQGLVGIFWQMPALLISLSMLLGLDQAADFSYYFIFMLQLWHTPILPLTTLQPVIAYLDKPLYYYALYLMAPLLWIFYLLPLLIQIGSPSNQK
jgi:hypothetical protein